MGRFSQPTLAFYLASKRDKLLTKSLDKALALSTVETKEGSDVGAMMCGAMEARRRFLKALTSSKATKGMKKILKRGYVELPLLGPAIGINGQDFMPPDTEALQTEAIKRWLEAYWSSHGFSCGWRQDRSNPDSLLVDWPACGTSHIVQGPPTPIWILRISW